MDYSGLFFQPVRQSLRAYAKDALNPAHARTFMVGSNNLFLLCSSIAVLWFKYAAFTTVFAPVLLTATAIMTIFDNILTATMATLIHYGFCYHSASLSLIT